MKKFQLIWGIALLAMATALVAIPVGPLANPEIYGEWRLDFNVDSGAFPTKGANGDCVFTGDIELTMNLPVPKTDEASKIPGDPVFGGGDMELVSGPCDDFLAGISGSALGNDIFFNMSVLPAVAKAEKGPGFGISFDGELIDSTLMEGIITGFVAKDAKGEFGTWRATRSRIVPAVTPAGILLLLAGLGLAGGIALRRRR